MGDGRRIPRRSQGGGGSRLAVLFLALVVVGAGASWPWLQPRLSVLSGFFAAGPAERAAPANGGVHQPSLAERVEFLEASLTPLATRLDYVERRLVQLETDSARKAAEPRKDPAPGADPAQLARLADEVAKLKAELAAVNKLSGEDGGASKLSGAIEKAEAAFRRFAERRDRAPLFLAALGQLREAVDRGTPYQPQLQAAVALADKATTAKLAIVGGGAIGGVVTRAGLVESFRLLAPAVRRQDVSPAVDWMPPMIRHWLASAVTVRRADGSEIGIEGALSSAARLLAGGDLAGAVGILRPVDGAAAAALAPWLEAAELRLSVDAALSELSAAAIASSSFSRDE